MTNATTLPLTVKTVRECALKTLTHQRVKLDERLAKIVEAHNADVERHNKSRFTKWFNRPLQEPEDIQPTVESWKRMWQTGQLRYGDPGYDELIITRVGWWKRLRQFTELPVADDEKIMNVSAEDLDLFDYNIWQKEQVVTS